MEWLQSFLLFTVGHSFWFWKWVIKYPKHELYLLLSEFNIVKAESNKKTKNGWSSLSDDKSAHIVSPQYNLISLRVVVFSYWAMFLHSTSTTNFEAYFPGIIRTG